MATAGVAAIVVSNRGSVRRGTDVLKALALGTLAVRVGRPLYFALAAARPLGVAQALRLLHDELEMALVLSGCRTPGEAGPVLVAELDRQRG